jgi:hypothetical protein
MIFCQSARVHIPEVMTKSFGCVWVIRQKICEEVPARAKNQEEREEKKEIFVETRREFTFLLFVFFSSTPDRPRGLFFIEKKFCEFLLRDSFFIKAELFLFFFANPLGKKKTRIHAHQNYQNKKSKEGQAREVKKESAFMRFHPFLRRVRTHNAQTERVLWARIFCFFLNEEEIFLSFRSEKEKKEALTLPRVFLSLSLSCCFLTFSRKEDGI